MWRAVNFFEYLYTYLYYVNTYVWVWVYMCVHMRYYDFLSGYGFQNLTSTLSHRAVTQLERFKEEKVRWNHWWRSGIYKWWSCPWWNRILLINLSVSRYPKRIQCLILYETIPNGKLLWWYVWLITCFSMFLKYSTYVNIKLSLNNITGVSKFKWV